MAIIDEPLPQAITRLREQHNDDSDYEAKRCANKLSEGIWESVSAFANTEGGTLLLGVDEQADFTVPEQFDADKTINQFVDGMGDGNTNGAKLTSPPRYTIHRDTVDGKHMVVVHIEENDIAHKPCYITTKGAQRGSYKRQDDKDVLLSPTELFEMQNVYEASEEDRKPLTDSDRMDLDGSTINAIIEAHSDTKALRDATSDEQKLERLNILDKKGHIRLAGLLVAGTYPQQFFPRLYIDVAVHPGTGKAQADEVRFLDRVHCDGRLQEMVDDAVKAVLRNLRTYSLIEGTSRREVPEIPPEVLREAIANAVVHREYGALFRNDPVNIDVYSDRVEISNPGGLWGGKTLDNLSNGVSRCRNATLMQLLQYTPSTHNGSEGLAVEGQGSGIQFMINQMTSRSLEQPRFQPTFDRFQVVLYRGGVELATNQQWVRSHAGHDLPGRVSLVIHTVRVLGQATVHDIRDRLGYDSDDIREMLAVLQEEGLVKQIATDVYKPVEESTAVASHTNAAPSTQHHILTAIPTSGTISAREIAETTGKSLQTVRRILRALVDAGDITAIGKKQSRSRVYTRNQPTTGNQNN